MINWISLTRLAEKTGRSREYIRQLCITGVLRSHQGGRLQGARMVSVSSWNDWNDRMASDSDIGFDEDFIDCVEHEPDFSSIRRRK